MSDKITVIIVEDEERIRNSLRALIEEISDDFEVVGCVSDGHEAIKLIKEQSPQLMFTDIQMPNMDGIELLEQVHENYPNLVTVVVSGHSDFMYAQKSMRYGVYNYLLKPVERQQLTETLNEIKNLVSRTRNKNNSNVAYSKNYNILTDEKTRFMLAIICIGNLINNEHSESVHRHYEQLMNSTDLESMLGHYLTNEWFLVDEYMVNEKALVIKCDDYDTAKLYDFLVNKISEESDINITMICLKQSVSKAELPHGIKTLRHLLRENLVVGEGSYNSFEEPTELRADTLELIKAKLKSATKNYLLLEDFDKYLKDIDSVFKSIVRNNCSQMVVEKTCVNIFTLLELSEKGFDFAKLDFLKNSMLNIIALTHHSNDLCELLSHEMMGIVDQTEYTKVSARDDKLVRYVNDNYLKIEGLDEVADKFGYNYSYVSRMFKKLTGLSMNQYIRSKRISLAKSLIEQYEHTPLSEIGTMCGYEDSKYFSRIFKSETGVSPSEFRSGLKVT